MPVVSRDEQQQQQQQHPHHHYLSTSLSYLHPQPIMQQQQQQQQPYARLVPPPTSPSPPPVPILPTKSSTMVRDSLTQISIPPRPSQLPRFYSPALSPALSPASTCTSATVSPLSSSSASSASSSPGLSVSPLAVFPSFTSRYTHPVLLDHFHPAAPYPSFPPAHSLLHPAPSSCLSQPKPKFASVAGPVSPLSGRSSSYPPVPQHRPTSGSLKRKLEADASNSPSVSDTSPSCSSPSPPPQQSPHSVSSPHSPVPSAAYPNSSFTFCPSPQAADKRRRTMQPPSPLPTHPHHISPRSLQALYPRLPQHRSHSPLPMQPSPSPSHSPSSSPLLTAATSPLPVGSAHSLSHLLPLPSNARPSSRPPSASLSPSVRRRRFLVPPIAIPSPPPSPLFFSSPSAACSPWLPSPSSSILMQPCPFPALRGRYSVRQSIEQSLFTSVKLAICVATKQQVAIKIARLASSTALRREAELLRYIHNDSTAEGVIEFVEALEDDEYSYLVLRYAQQGDLHSLLSCQPNGALPAALAQRTFAEIVEGVWSLRCKGVAHLDLSLENVVLCSNGDVRIIDLGSACVHPSMAPSPALVHPLAVAAEAVTAEDKVMPLTYPCGAYPSSLPLPSKPSYSSPELLVNHLPSQPTASPSSPTSPAAASFDAFSADVFSLGVLLYLLCTGRPPFTRPCNSDEWWLAISSGEWLREGGVRDGEVGKEVYGRVDESALRLIGRLLVCQDKRATLQEVREHEWVKQGREMAEMSIAEKKAEVQQKKEDEKVDLREQKAE